MMRFFQIATVLFWLGTMGWLATTILTPDGVGMTPVDPRRPVKIFFDWNDTTRLLLLQNGRKLGEIQVVGFASDEKGNPAGFSIAAMLNGDVAPPVMGTFARTLFRFEEDFTLQSSDFLFRMPSNNFRILASVKGAGQVMKAEVSLGGASLFSYDGGSENQIPPAMMEIVKRNTMVTDFFAKTGNPGDWKWNLEAFRGTHRFAGRRLPVYLLKLSADQSDQTLRIYFSESGEPLQLETDLGIEAISEVLAPIERIPLEREAEFP